MGYNLEGKAEIANSGPWCQLTLVTGWVKGKLGSQSRRVDHYISLEPVVGQILLGKMFLSIVTFDQVAGPDSRLADWSGKMRQSSHWD